MKQLHTIIIDFKLFGICTIIFFIAGIIIFYPFHRINITKTSFVLGVKTEVNNNNVSSLNFEKITRSMHKAYK
jgi:hypothetical protein